MYGTAHATSRGRSTRHDMRWLCARLMLAICPRGSCCPRVASILRRFLHGQISTSGPKRPFAPQGRRRDDELGPGSAKRVFAKAVHLRRMASAVGVSDSGM